MTSPSTALVRKVSPNLKLRGFVEWVAEEVERIRSNTTTAAATGQPRFLGYFAQPIKRGDLPGGVRPTGVFLDLSKLEHGITDGDLAVFLQGSARGGAALTQIPDDVVLGALQLLGEPGTVQAPPVKAAEFIVLFEGFKPAFSLRANKESYSVDSRKLHKLRIGNRDGSDLERSRNGCASPTTRPCSSR